MIIRALISGYGKKYYKYMNTPIKNFNQVTEQDLIDKVLFHEKIINYIKF